ncbi:insulinase family protein [Lujinxingia vulgaris]|uniref:Insulinase family protein n=1 Tax=Lujinxingia vulgaris TaxID=2600176 RepID=A0A5C6XJI8_9DELT|nr:pitrilysin family protein [Lujinxingia vulgaris]TXD37779.1 insulinase family protein [Lujinxingia vulgaris]
MMNASNLWMRSCVALGAAAVFAACSGGAPTPDETPTEAPAPNTAASDRPIPELRELSFIEGSPEITELESSETVRVTQVGELKVIHRITPANQVVVARLITEGGQAGLTESIAGIERLALGVAAGGGTLSTPKDAFNARLDSVGASVGSFASADYSGMSMRSVVEHFDTTWELFTQAVLEPAFPEEEVELQRTRQIASIESIKDDPDALVGELVSDLYFRNHAYENRQIGTVESVSALSTDELKAWQRSLLEPERMLLVVVGNIDHDLLVERVAESFGRLAPAEGDVPGVAEVEHTEPALEVIAQELPTNYIMGYFEAPALNEADYPAMLLATRYLRDRLFEEVRTRRNLTYAVSAGMASRKENFGYLYVTATDPAATLPVMFAEVERLQDEMVSDAALEKIRNVFLTSHYMNLQTNASQAGMLADHELLGGGWQEADAFLDAINAVTPADIQRVAQVYMGDYQFAVVGNPEAVPGELFGVEDDAVEETQTEEVVGEEADTSDESAPAEAEPES